MAITFGYKHLYGMMIKLDNFHASNFSMLSPFKSDVVNMERLKDEFIEYKLLDYSCIPNVLWKRTESCEDQSAPEF